ncbi:MAG: transporter [Calditrichaeota bacterium]|nr:MAG: transporter [Calditrichota bacterium]MBL1205701.1 transporter [Calditrichota bacterium]NOG45529.1 transporter [Calditrichota bacterium]
MLKKFTMLVSTIIFSASMVFGSGFSIYEQGAKATAMGGAFIAQANDVTSVFYNPAGITSQEGFQIGLGTTIIIPAFAFQGPDNLDPNLYTEAKDLVFPPSTFYATYQINDKLTAGFGFYTLFGLGSEWDQNWAGRQLATNSHVQTFYLNPVVAYEIMDGLSVSAGFNYVIGNVTLEKSIWFGPRNVFGESKLDASGNGMGFNAGFQFKATDDLTIGAIYRSNVLLEFDGGDATFEFPTTDNPIINAEIGALFPETKGSSEIELPTMIGFGVAYQFTDKLIAEFDWMQLGWSSYDELKITFDDPVGGSTESLVERKWEDSASLRFGLQYSINDDVDLRLGYLRDNKAVPDERVEPSLPEGDRNLYSIGFGYRLDNLTIDGFYMLLTQDDRKITTSVDDFNGEYTGLSSLFGVSFQYGL